MKKTVIASISLWTPAPVRYGSADATLPSSDQKYANPVISYLERTMTSDDDISIILLVKTNGDDRHEDNIRIFKEELQRANAQAGARIKYDILPTEFYEESGMQEDMLLGIVDKIQAESHIIADITYGSKESPIIVFTALGYAKRFLRCEIDKIIYGHTEFTKDRVLIEEKTRLSDMTSLFYLTSLTNTLKCDDPDKAKSLLHTIVKG